ncbi:papain fold toxin domain-containing protein [Chryseobacterium rhizosphaerae]|uniref:papain fold toxin domain-containing protein n=1 Tax=Chryseobacterium rhizosphaerae TaxID=395937 RepID=UPI003D13B5F9
MCKDFASCLLERMTAQGIKGEMVTLKSSRNIWSDTFNMNISTNGDHVGVKVGNMVYDNLYPQGIKFNNWMMDLQVGSQDRKWGVVINHDYKKIIQIPTSSVVKWK